MGTRPRDGRTLKIVAYDTGKLTGVAWHFTNAGMLIESDQYEREQAEDHMASFIPWADIVICEKLSITAATVRKTRDIQPAIEMVGLVKYLCRVHQKELVEQPPSDVMGFATNDKLKRIGWYPIPGAKGDHQSDARRHILALLADRRLIDLSTLLAGGSE